MTDRPTVRLDSFRGIIHMPPVGEHDAGRVDARFVRCDADGCFYGVSDNPRGPGRLFWQVPQNSDGRRPCARMVVAIEEHKMPTDVLRRLLDSDAYREVHGR